MTYAELYDIAHAIGFHKGRMALAEDWEAVLIDQDFFSTILQAAPAHHRTMAVSAYGMGSIEGEQI